MCKIRLAIFVSLIVVTSQGSFAQQPIVTVSKIWDKAPHNAFTDLVKYDDKFYCTFREATGHVPRKREEDGKIRIIVSEDGVNWNSAGLIEKKTVDLRDSKLSVTPDNRLMVLMGGSYYDNGTLLKRICQVSFLDKETGKFSLPQPIVVDEAIKTDVDWLWRVTWHDGIGYGIIYQAEGDSWDTHLVSTSDGIQYEHVSKLQLPGKPNESTIRFTGDSVMWIVTRNEDGENRGHLGQAVSPYEQIAWATIDQRLGGPNIIQLPNGSWILATRRYGGETRTIVSLKLKGSQFETKLTLPSGGDTSYPGLLVENDHLWVSYYSSHEGKSSIYLAQIPIEILSSDQR